MRTFRTHWEASCRSPCPVGAVQPTPKTERISSRLIGWCRNMRAPSGRHKPFFFYQDFTDLSLFQVPREEHFTFHIDFSLRTPRPVLAAPSAHLTSSQQPLKLSQSRNTGYCEQKRGVTWLHLNPSTSHLHYLNGPERPQNPSISSWWPAYFTLKATIKKTNDKSRLDEQRTEPAVLYHNLWFFC